MGDDGYFTILDKTGNSIPYYWFEVEDGKAYPVIETGGKDGKGKVRGDPVDLEDAGVDTGWNWHCIRCSHRIDNCCGMAVYWSPDSKDVPLEDFSAEEIEKIEKFMTDHHKENAFYTPARDEECPMFDQAWPGGRSWHIVGIELAKKILELWGHEEGFDDLVEAYFTPTDEPVHF